MREPGTHHFLRLIILASFCITLLASSGSADTANDTGSGFIVVTNPPSADFYTSTRYGTAPFTVSFSDSSRGAAPFSYHWDFGDNSTSDRQHPYHTYKVNGEYTVSLTVSNSYGSDTRTMPAYIGVGDPLNATFSLSTAGGPVPLTVTAYARTQSLPANWSWDFGDGATAFGQSVVHTYTTSGNYDLSLTVTNRFEPVPVTMNRTIVVGSPAPTPVVTQAPPEEVKPEGIIGLIQLAKGTTTKNLPASGFIPPQFMALAAVITSLAVVLVQLIVVNIGIIWQFLLKFLKFFTDLLWGHAVEKLSAKEIEARRIEARKLEPHFLGLSSTEVLVIESAVFIVALAFMLADRAELTLTTVLIYMGVGGISVVIHDFAHRVVVTRHGHDADTRFWGLGTAILFITAWLFGNAFALSYRNLVRREGGEVPREVGTEMVAGPVVSLILMAFSLAMVSLGGLWAVAGGIGFTINLMTALYSLMPIETMDGLGIWRWNKGVFLCLFVPVFAFYLFTYIVVA